MYLIKKLSILFISAILGSFVNVKLYCLVPCRLNTEVSIALVTRDALKEYQSNQVYRLTSLSELSEKGKGSRK